MRIIEEASAFRENARNQLEERKAVSRFLLKKAWQKRVAEAVRVPKKSRKKKSVMRRLGRRNGASHFRPR